MSIPSPMVETTQTQPQNPLYAGRLRDLDESRLKADGCAEAFDETSSAAVLVALEPKTRGQNLPAITSVSHAHLAKVVAVLDHDESWLVLTKSLRGTTLRSRVAAIGRKHAVDAVRTALRVADALGHLHEVGLTHGRVNPDNVLLGLDEGVEPALVYGQPSSASYLHPERTSSNGPLDPRDDTWAATALLYFMLSGDQPPSDGLPDPSALDDLRINDPLLCEVLFHGLAKDENRRAKDLNALRHELARWFIDHAADEPMPVGGIYHRPPPLPASNHPPARQSHVPPSSVGRTSGTPGKNAAGRGWLRSLPFSAGAIIVGLALAWGLAKVRRSSNKPVLVQERVVPAAAAVPEPSASASAGPIDLAEVPVVGKEQESGDSTASCASGYLREGTLVKRAALEPICRDGDLPHVLGTLRAAFASSVGAAPATAVRFDHLGWYSLPLLLTLRKACCTDPPPLKLPDLGAACGDFATNLDELANAAATTQQLDAAIVKFAAAARCAAGTGRASGISPAAPSPAMERVFREALTVAANP